MPGLARKLLIFAAVDGIILQPLSQRGQQRPSPPAKIAYGGCRVGPVRREGVENGGVDGSGEEGIASVDGKEEGGALTEGSKKGFEAWGVIGLLSVSSSTYLVSITRRQQVAIIQGKAIYVATEVALTPVTSRQEAESSIAHTAHALQKGSPEIGHGLDGSDTEGEGGDGTISPHTGDDVDDDDVLAPPAPTTADATAKGNTGHKRTSSVAEDVITRKGGYGRFAQKWFSKKGWSVDQMRNLGMSVGVVENDTAIISEPPAKDSTVPVSTVPAAQNIKHDFAANLLPKLLRTTQILFGASRSFYFSYDYDITRRLANRRMTASELPLYTQVDPLFFWNHHLIQPFIDGGQASMVLPLMQGFVGQQEFEMDPDPPKPVLGLEGAEKSAIELTDISAGGRGQVEGEDIDCSAASIAEQKHQEGAKSIRSYLLTLISRRSVKRAGLRYLRRGVDEEGHTANGVETEQILSQPTWNTSNNVHSFVQVRGSIPIFFSQTPYSFKPVPQIQHSADMNHSACVKHFENISEQYNDIQVVSLVEKHGHEAIVGEAYEHHVDRINRSGGINGKIVGFEWFDFHALCRGMKFENVGILIETLGEKLDSFGHTVEVDGKQATKQTGVLRTNCMDCLDRTNVVQSAVARRALELQLKSEGIDMSLQADQTTRWFNTIWADNGDAISKQYASTAAMKGDFTRTRKRNYRGALTDMGLSISRFLSGIVNDFFSQAAIDFLLGSVTSLVFSDFESNLMSSDPGVSMQKMRQQAIDMCQRLVVADEHEEFINGWTVLTPQTSNTIKSMPFEESVLLLTDAALYSCRFDWNVEKVSSFERVDLQHIVAIKYGTYITSTLSAAQADERRNTGFVVTYHVGANDIRRVNTRSMSNVQQQDRTSTDLLTGTAITPPALAAGLANLLGSAQTAPTTRVLALKALPASSALEDGGGSEAKLSELELVKGICAEIERMALLGRVVEVGTERKGLVAEGTIISLAEARKSTGLLEQLGHSLKKMVWA